MMAIFGWLILLFISISTTVWFLVAVYIEIKFTGKVSGGAVLVALIPSCFWAVTLLNIPFLIVARS